MESVETEQAGPVDAVVGIVPSPRDGHAIENTIARVVESSLPLKIALVHPPYTASGEPPKLGPQWRLIAYPQLAQDGTGMAQGPEDSYRAIFDAARDLGARACALVASDLSGAGEDWTARLLQPVLEQQFDLVTPCYAHHPFGAMINRAIVYPLTRALYGKQIRHPLGPDFGVSSALLQRFAGLPKTRLHAFPTLTIEAVTNGMAICQAHLGARAYAQPDWTNLSSLLAKVLGPVFLDVERYAAHWQRTRGSRPVPEFGTPTFGASPDSAVDVRRLIESFQLGTRNLPEIWSIILPPSTLVELRRMGRNGDGPLRMPDLTWARVVYDFALAHRLRAISRDQMLRALTPIYLGWVASYAQELEHASPEEAEQRLEKLCIAYEEAKNYFVSRWRWPDRFNP